MPAGAGIGVGDERRIASGRTGHRSAEIAFRVRSVFDAMRILTRLAGRRRADDGRKYVCTLCGATYDERSVVVCPKCRGFVVAREK
ncbi:hypothetical protein [Halorussus lipolyticus]|uniref:hypothetical protein n=1 Tax=Halorussus lipolyticus TaxID=3034024 RepID=UPI0023E7CAAC|nr:hypothetical protein [Halorussus sp. DT80]